MNQPAGERERAAEALRQEIYDLWKRLKPDFGQASSQAILRGWIIDFEEAARREERKRCAEPFTSADVAQYALEVSQKKGLRIEKLVAALEEISRLPLGDHRAKKIALAALEER